MNDQDIATFFLESLSRRLSGKEIAICLGVEKAGTDESIPGLFVSTEDRRLFDGLKTQFASELANAGKVVTP